jgi:hypothetical protein
MLYCYFICHYFNSITECQRHGEWIFFNLSNFYFKAKYKIYFQCLIDNQEASSLWVSPMKQTRIADATNIYYLIVKPLILFICDWCLFSEYVVIV